MLMMNARNFHRNAEQVLLFSSTGCQLLSESCQVQYGILNALCRTARSNAVLFVLVRG